MSELKCGIIEDENVRYYNIYDGDGEQVKQISIHDPEKVWYGKGHAFHRVYDGELVTLCPAPGFIWGECGKIVGFCELSWEPKDKDNPCQW